MSSCKQCKGVESGSYSLAKCDTCKSLLCVNCSTLSGSEHKGVTVKTRSSCVQYTCKDCIATVRERKSDGTENDKESVVITKLVRQGFEDIKATIMKNEKIFTQIHKSIDNYNTNVILKMDDISKFISGVQNINKETQPLSDATTTLQSTENYSKLYEDLKHKYEAQQVEILDLKTMIKTLQTQMDRLFNQDNATEKGKNLVNSKKPENLHPVTTVISKEQVAQAVAEAQQKTTNKIQRTGNTTKITGTRNLNEDFVAKEVTWLYVTKYRLTYTVDELEDYLGQKFAGKKFICELLPNKGKSCNSFKVGVDTEMIPALMDPRAWPAGI